MSSQTGSLRKAPLSAETLEKCLMTELNIVNFIIQTTYTIELDKARNAHIAIPETMSSDKCSQR